MTRRKFFCTVGSATTVILTGCGGEEPLNTNHLDPEGKPDLYVRLMDNDQEPEIYLPDGSLLSQDAMSGVITLILPKNGKECVIAFLEEGSPPPSKTADGRWAFTVGCYRIMGRWEGGYVGGCIRRNEWRHINFQVRNGDYKND